MSHIQTIDPLSNFLESQGVYIFYLDIPNLLVENSYDSYPLYNEDSNILIGSFVLYKGSIIKGYISGYNHSTALQVSTNEIFYFTPVINENENVYKGLISGVKLSNKSMKVRTIKWQSQEKKQI